MNEGIGLAEALLGLPGFRVLEVVETTVELVVTIETTCSVTSRSRSRADGAARRSSGTATCLIGPTVPTRTPTWVGCRPGRDNLVTRRFQPRLRPINIASQP